MPYSPDRASVGAFSLPFCKCASQSSTRGRREEEELAAAFHVESIPMVVLMKDGKAVDTSVGYRPKEDLVKMLEK